MEELGQNICDKVEICTSKPTQKNKQSHGSLAYCAAAHCQTAKSRGLI